MVGRLAGGIAHDFNNLLTAIGGHAEVLLASLDPEDPRRPDVTPILDAAARAADLTRQLLAFGRREVLHPTVVAPGDVIERLRPMLRSIVPADVDLVIRLDPVRTPVAELAQEARRDGSDLRLVVDHEEGAAGISVVEAANGEEAIVAWSRERIDALVTDVVLPGLSGPDLAARFQAHRPGLPVLLVSGYARESLVADGRALAGSSFLAKPFSKDQLALRLRELFEPTA
jgi:CheY-like chemotaxis protein